MKDTHPVIEKKYNEMLMSLNGMERLIMACDMFDTAKEIVLSSLPPGLSPTERAVQFFLRMYGNDFDKVNKNKIVNYIIDNKLCLTPRST
jgi:hypothetical protein